MTDCIELTAATRQPPLLLAQAWRDYIAEHCTRKGQEVRRVVYVARHWLRIFGPDAEVATWRRRDIDIYHDRRKAEGAMAATIRREMCLQRAALNPRTICATLLNCDFSIFIGGKAWIRHSTKN